MTLLHCCVSFSYCVSFWQSHMSFEGGIFTRQLITLCPSESGFLNHLDNKSTTTHERNEHGFFPKCHYLWEMGKELFYLFIYLGMLLPWPSRMSGRVEDETPCRNMFSDQVKWAKIISDLEQGLVQVVNFQLYKHFMTVGLIKKNCNLVSSCKSK